MSIESIIKRLKENGEMDPLLLYKIAIEANDAIAEHKRVCSSKEIRLVDNSIACLDCGDVLLTLCKPSDFSEIEFKSRIRKTDASIETSDRV